MTTDPEALTKDGADYTGGQAIDDDDLDDDLDDIELDKVKSNVPTKKKLALKNTIFARRQSTQTGKSLVWTNVNMQLMGKGKGRGKPEKIILDNVWGEAKAGQTTAIMGASGAGKTSLFNTLSGRARSSGRIQVNAKLQLGGIDINPSVQHQVRSTFAFVSQDDALHVPSTPRQALTFSARLRLPKTMTKEEIDDLVSAYLQELGLTDCADTRIGNELQKGISGGEKRRVSIGIELISAPRIIFLDEPTSGLDSFAARQVMQLLQSVAKAGNTVLFTIHQPSSNVFASFDKLILLNKGRLMYTGSTSQLPNDFQDNNFPIPPNYNPADWILDVAQEQSIERLEQSGFFPKDSRTWISSADKRLSLPPIDLKTDHVSFWTELGMLVEREKDSLIKNPLATVINVGITGFLSVVFGVIFYGIGGQSRNNLLVLQAQLGALVNVLISTMMGQSQPALIVFAEERPLFLREYSTSHYGVASYFISHLISEGIKAFIATLVQAIIVYFMIDFQQDFFEFLGLTYALTMTTTAVSVFLGSFFTDTKAAESLFVLVAVPQIFFSGVFIATSLIPVWVRWGQYLCSMTYAARLGFIYEFKNCGPEGSIEDANCRQILMQNEVNPDDEWWYWVCLLALFVTFRLAAMMVLRYKGATLS